MKLGTWVRLPDGRIGIVVYNSLIGVGIKWEPDALLRDYVAGLERYGFSQDECVGCEFEVIREGYWPED